LTGPRHSNFAWRREWAVEIAEVGPHIDAERAIKVPDGAVDLIPEGQWKQLDS
jgi:hypothetical protein